MNGSSSSWGTTWFTRPHCNASWRVEEVAGEAHLLRPAHADGLGEQHGEAPARHHADAGVRVAELRPFRRDEEVAVERELEAAGDGGAVDRADDRLRPSAGTDRAGRAACAAVGIAGAEVAARRAELLQVEARAERRDRRR